MTQKHNRVKTIQGIKTVKSSLPLLFGLVSIFCLTVTQSIAVETSIRNITVETGDTVRVKAFGNTGLKATFSIPRIIKNRPMVEARRGTYIGDFKVIAGKHPDGTYDVAVNFNGVTKVQENALVIDKTPPMLWEVETRRTIANGDTLPLAVNIGEWDLRVTADISALDTTQSHPISLLPGENGVYSAEIGISEDNVAVNGVKEILITAKDEAGNISQLTATITLNNLRYLTELLPNYPNPFNPETWIPYRLAEDAEVTLTIYDISGDVVRQFHLGHQRAGSYETKSEAVYWDGTTDSGEPVASGIYFYNLSIGDFSKTRKATILK